MKNNILLLLIAIVTLGITSCSEDSATIDYGTPTAETFSDSQSDIYLTDAQKTISFVAGNDSYDFSFLVRTPGSDAASKVEVYKSFTSSKTGETVGPVLLKTYDVTQGAATTKITDKITYDDLKSGIDVLPSAQTEIPVGSSWALTFKPVDGSGAEAFASSAVVNVAVLSPYAGRYEVLQSAYYRIGVQSGLTDWSGQERFIGSIDDDTFSHNTYFGPAEFFNDTVEKDYFVFDLNEDLTITIPKSPEDGHVQNWFSGNEFLTCQDDSSLFTNVPCDGSNVLVPSEDGRHVIVLTYGYFTASGDENEGAREFYEVLRKIK